MLTDRREALTRRRVQTVDRLQAVLAELLPGQAKKDITTGQAKAMLGTVRPRDIAGKTRRRIAAEGRVGDAHLERGVRVTDRDAGQPVLPGEGGQLGGQLSGGGFIARFRSRNEIRICVGGEKGVGGSRTAAGTLARHFLQLAVRVLVGEGPDRVHELIATGARYRKLPVPCLEEFEKTSVYYAATQSEAQLCRNHPVVTVGGGNSAGQATLFLSQYVSRLSLVVREHGFALGWEQVELPNPLFPGDTLYSETEVLEVRESRSRPTQGIVRVETRGYNQNGDLVMSYRRSVMVYKREHAPGVDIFPEPKRSTGEDG